MKYTRTKTSWKNTGFNAGAIFLTLRDKPDECLTLHAESYDDGSHDRGDSFDEGHVHADGDADEK